MLPNVETVNNNTSASGNVQPRRQEMDYVAETYKAARDNSESAGVSEKTGAVAEAQKQSQVKGKSKTDVLAAAYDQAELNFSLNREERDVFISAFSGKQDPATMSDEERETLQKASERITRYIDSAIAKNAENRERVEKAVSEWYSRISKGDRQGPNELIGLLRAAAMGSLDEQYKG